MDLQDRAETLARLMEERLDIRGPDLAAKTRRARRRVPRWLRRELMALVQALEYSRHPKFAARIDHARIETGARRAQNWLEQVDATDRRKSLVIHWLAGNAFNVLVVIGLAVGVMAWRGLI
ncbi:hypothetical protein GQE99_06255 [Maritimibacter sp. DP07]|uniref:Uncharacterized protein n=1 Tax=Maritimibacter harenae TaxID=2606218 RepID=A0A845M8K8_9RHOB|nr:hypothetical protein [Maritimibacter harenae]MZR12621.1 hypothetical protein [Maritimibacter harenae]